MTTPCKKHVYKQGAYRDKRYKVVSASAGVPYSTEAISIAPDVSPDEFLHEETARDLHIPYRREGSYLHAREEALERIRTLMSEQIIADFD